MRRDDDAVGQELTRELGLSEEEARTYLRALHEEIVNGDNGDEETFRSLCRRGMLIKAADEKGYLPVHPRLALSNLFRSYGDRTTQEMREKRKTVDRLTAELIPIYEIRRKTRGELR